MERDEEDTNKEIEKATEMAVALGKMAAKWDQEPRLTRTRTEGQQGQQAN